MAKKIYNLILRVEADEGANGENLAQWVKNTLNLMQWDLKIEHNVTVLESRIGSVETNKKDE